MKVENLGKGSEGMLRVMANVNVLYLKRMLAINSFGS